MVSNNSDYIYIVPVITEFSITPNPAIQNQQIEIVAKIEEKTIILEPEMLYSGTFYSGEDR